MMMSWLRRKGRDKRGLCPRMFYRHIQKLEGLLAYAVAHNDAVEAVRLRAELTRIVEGL